MVQHIYPQVAGTDLRNLKTTKAPSADWTNLRKKLPDMTGKRVIVLGSQNGWLNEQAVIAGALASLGVDASRTNVATARAAAISSRLRYRLMPTATWPILGGQYDLIIVPNVGPENYNVLANTAHLLRHGHGRIVLSGVAEYVQQVESSIYSSDHRSGSWSASDLAKLPSGNVMSILRRSRLGGHQR
ncbi:class I SAM-dependent methyltransferase [Lacticaseibacillus songhuajiangensis]|jgi:2-polyprenyl-3-methyl-5-hydroxy-6-metoxy-1,4-benzoquinol methylase|uniref:class I SAM-dependent methyltransferase n=1 Tax=Lacticaseibacillus songhuajiangensis TaxID=1296539 RepID=UPI000F79C789|nr:hypothetical protein [Lacticaseibacillus songhuajiangensis]